MSDETTKMDSSSPVSSEMPAWVPANIEELQQLVLVQDAQKDRLYALVSELGNLFDALHPVLDAVVPGWWEKQQPLLKIREELAGWQPERVCEAKHRLGLVVRGLPPKEAAETLQKRRTTLTDEQRQELGY
ncbi:hypothetical protein [Gloeobacter violaceus]|uniref:hypothetical protein n=1 Tax=Gloeobacter violaceus TaxID=33072 RepID=UPI0013E89BAB|nr:hypothetical protein [Gloeobacter violaceus]